MARISALFTIYSLSPRLPIGDHMELRTEPRFETRSSASVEVVRDKVYTYETTITQVSGTGFRLEMAAVAMVRISACWLTTILTRVRYGAYPPVQLVGLRNGLMTGMDRKTRIR